MTHFTRQINLYRMFFADLSVNSQLILQGLFSSHGATNMKYYIVQKLDHFNHLTCSTFVFTTSLYKPIKRVKLKFVFSPELH